MILTWQVQALTIHWFYTANLISNCFLHPSPPVSPILNLKANPAQRHFVMWLNLTPRDSITILPTHRFYSAHPLSPPLLQVWLHVTSYMSQKQQKTKRCLLPMKLSFYTDIHAVFFFFFCVQLRCCLIFFLSTHLLYVNWSGYIHACISVAVWVKIFIYPMCSHMTFHVSSINLICHFLP